MINNQDYEPSTEEYEAWLDMQYQHVKSLIENSDKMVMVSQDAQDRKNFLNQVKVNKLTKNELKNKILNECEPIPDELWNDIEDLTKDL